MKLPVVTTVDFESEAIHRRPHYPPKPVSVAIKRPGERKPTFFSWGHATDNNCTFEKAKAVLQDVWRWAACEGNALLTQHGKFDTDVGEVHVQLPALPWDHIHDTEYLLFLHDPHARSLALKPSAERILGLPPEERDAVRDWLVAQGIVKKKQKDWGAHISKAPGSVVGPYANGDITRTDGLFKKLYPEIVERGMRAAYDRERRLMPVLLESERGGIRCDLLRLEKDFKSYMLALDIADRWLRRALRAPGLNLDADQELGNVLDREGIVTEWTWTAGVKKRAPQRSVSKRNLTIAQFHDRQIALMYAYRNWLSTCLARFVEWLGMARESNGIIYTNWNQVRQSHGENLVGTRTGRLSSNPNYQNISKDFEDKDDGYEHPDFDIAVSGYAQLRETGEEILYQVLGQGARLPKQFYEMIPAFNGCLSPLPLMRQYLLPDQDAVWLHRDYNQQELRMLAHFEDGDLCAHYNREPRFDIHTTMQNKILEMIGVSLTRAGTKILNFSDVYGKGLTNLAISLGVSFEVAKSIRAAKNALMPGVDKLTRDIKMRGQSGFPIRTWGGREYYAEAPAYSKKFDKVMEFYYKLLNYLVQGSSADVTKEATCRYNDHPKRRARFLLTVHDEENASSPSCKGISAKAKQGLIQEEMQVMQEVMESVEVDVPMITDGKTGPNWGTLSKWED